MQIRTGSLASHTLPSLRELKGVACETNILALPHKRFCGEYIHARLPSLSAFNVY